MDYVPPPPLQSLDLVVKLWPIFTAIIGGVVWAIYRVESKVGKVECKAAQVECRSCQKDTEHRLEQQIRELRIDLTTRLDDLTKLFIERYGK